MTPLDNVRRDITRIFESLIAMREAMTQVETDFAIAIKDNGTPGIRTCLMSEKDIQKGTRYNVLPQTGDMDIGMDTSKR